MIQKASRRRVFPSSVIDTTFRLMPDGRFRIRQVKPFARRFDNSVRQSRDLYRTREEAQQVMYWGSVRWTPWVRSLSELPE